jgi:Recombinase
MDRACPLKPVLSELTSAGLSMRAIAAELTMRGIPSAGGGKWHPQMVSRVLARVAL